MFVGCICRAASCLKTPTFLPALTARAVPWLRHCLPFDEKHSTGKITVAQNDLWLAKRRRAMLENNPPRNNQLETHRDDEAGDGVYIVPGRLDSHRIDRFPDA